MPQKCLEVSRLKRKQNHLVVTDSRAEDLRKKYRDKDLFGGNREKAIQRDKEKCVKCEMTRQEHKIKFFKDITVDHIDGKGRNSNSKNHSLDNLQTLCCVCHGRKDGSRCRDKIKLKSVYSAIYKSKEHAEHRRKIFRIASKKYREANLEKVRKSANLSRKRRRAKILCP